MRQAPRLPLLDEPTAAIDPIAEDALLSGYLAAARGIVTASGGITVFASHRLSMAGRRMSWWWYTTAASSRSAGTNC
jgi:ATP-binding cassette subfamily B protein/ATP-binding cassette subfamily C protein